MNKQGILHDYDLNANLETSAINRTCIVCGASPMTFQWSDYSGEGMCTRCGCAYQLKWGSEEQQIEGKYPYLNVKEDFISILREYWEETKSFVCHGRMMCRADGVAEFSTWVKEKHPEMMGDDK